MIVCVIDVIFPAKIGEEAYREFKSDDSASEERSGDLVDDLESESSSSDTKTSDKPATRKRKTRREDGFSKATASKNEDKPSKKEN